MAFKLGKAAALAAAMTFAANDMPLAQEAPQNPLSHKVTACTKDGERATLSYDFAISPFYVIGRKLIRNEENVRAFANELNTGIATPLETRWKEIVEKYNANELRTHTAKPEYEFFRASHQYMDHYGIDKMMTPNVGIELTGGTLKKDLTCAQPA